MGRGQGFMIKGVAISLEVELNLKGRGQELEYALKGQGLQRVWL